MKNSQEKFSLIRLAMKIMNILYYTDLPVYLILICTWLGTKAVIHIEFHAAFQTWDGNISDCSGRFRMFTP